MKRFHPPKWADQFLKWYCTEELLEEIQGDLHEAYHVRRINRGKIIANWLYVIDVFKFFKPYSFEKYSRTKQYLPMFNNYIKIASRNLLKRKSFTIMNLVGLVAGISSIFLVSLYLHHELNYDSSNPDADRIYRLVNTYRNQTYTCMSFPSWYSSTKEQQLNLTNSLKSYDGVLESCQFVTNQSDIGPHGRYYVQVNGKQFVEEDLLYTNTGMAFHSLFPQQFKAGSPEQAFSQFDRVILTESKAVQFFGENWESAGVVGTILDMQDETFEIAGVIEDVKGNVHFNFEILVHQEMIPSWGAYTYLKLNENASIETTLAQLNRDVNTIYPGYTDDELQKGISSVPLTEIHFTSGMLYELKPTANSSYMLTFGIVGLIILLIIWTNYTNLSIATYSGRQKEMGVRKVLGARSNDIAMQILTEAIMLTMICIPFAWLIVFGLLPSFNQLMGIGVDSALLYSPIFVLLIIVILFITGIISGLYPALIFSRKSLVRLFKGKLSGSSNRLWNIRNGILASQFFMLIVLISIVFVIRNQMSFIQNKDLGFEKERVLFFDVAGLEKYRLLKEKLKQLPEVEKVGAGLIPGSDMYNQLTYKMKESDITYSDGTNLSTSLNTMEILGIKSSSFELLESQDSVFIINETAAKKIATELGVEPYDLIGKTLISEPEWENELFGNGMHYTIADVIEDFDYFNLRHESQSLLIEVRREVSWLYTAMIKLNTNDMLSSISDIENIYLDVEKEIPFDINFLDDHLDQIYQQEKNAGTLTAALTAVSVLLAIMGLIGIIGFVTISRQKEIGVRKVFGASIVDILFSLSKEYLIMIGLATVLSIPTAIYLSNMWLETFAYRINPTIFSVLLSAMITLILVVFVVILQSYKSANLNPSEALRNE